MSDEHFLLEQWHDTLHQFREDYEKWERHTLKDYLEKCAEIVNNQIKYKMLDIKVEGISAYLYAQLNKEGITVSDRHIQNILPEDYKRNYNKTEQDSELEKQNWEIIETEDPSIRLEKNQFNSIKINGVEQRAKEIKKETTQQPLKSKSNKDTRELIYLKSCSKLSNKFHLTFETLIDRYNKSDEVQEIIDNEIGNVEIKLGEYAKMWANIENSKGMVDLRRDFGEYEKIMGTFMIETGETIARIAQLMDYSEKYGSIGLLREPKVRAFFEKEDTYPLYLRSCPNCFTDISHDMNYNIALYRASKELGIDIPVIKYN
ncbi:MAG: hypothetical protein HN490_00015 [Gammaproteobacteria bacterium]|mgnify:CR=1 FL=1|nr:hypothetical protein [Gammaproteobacteria bacterium]